MKQVSDKFKRGLKQYGRQIDAIITYTENGTNKLLDSDTLFSVTPITNGNLLKSVMKQLTFESSVKVPKGTIVNFQFGVLIDLGLSVQEVNAMKVNRLNNLQVKELSSLKGFEYIDFGNYIVAEEPEYNADTFSYTHKCYDKMLYAMQDYESLNVTYPITIKNYLNSLATKIGLTLKQGTFYNENKNILNELYLDTDGNSLGYTYRDVLDEIAQATGSIICISNDDKLEVRYLNETNETINADMLKDVDVGFKEHYGAINVVVLSRSAGADNIYYPEELPQNPVEIKIQDNQILNYDNRNDYTQGIYNAVNGINYYINDFKSTGICYLELGDKYNVEIDGVTYNCILLNDEIDITQGLEEQIHTDMPEQSETDYKKADKTDRKIAQTTFTVDKQNQQIQGIVSQIGDRSQKTTTITADIDGLNSKVSSVETNVTTAQNTANTAITKADTAQTTADNAQSTANTAVGKADNAQSTADGINTNLTNNYYTKTETNSEITQKANEITSTVSQTYSTKTETATAKSEAINSANSSTDNKLQNYSTTTQMNSAITQKANEINSRIDEIADLTNEVQGTKTILLENCVEGSLLELHIYGNNSVFDYLYPQDDLYPANDLYPYGDSRIVVTDQNGNSKTYELGITDVLRQNGNVKDEYILQNSQAKVIRRINKNGTIKTNEDIKDLGEVHIDIAEGTNTITIKNYTAPLKAKFAIKSDYTEVFATRVEMNSSITQTAEEINLEVRKKVDENEVISKINQSAEAVGISANKINLSANDVLNLLSGNTINLSGRSIKISSNNFNVDENGNMTCSNANITGGKLNISANVGETVFKTYSGNNYVEVRPNGISLEDSNGNYGTYGVNSFQIQDGDDEISAFAGYLSVFSDNNATYISGSSVTTPQVIQTSQAEKKKNFEKFNNALDIVKKIDIYKYNLKNEDDNAKKHIGFVIGDDYKYSEEVTSKNNDGADIYSFVSLCCQAIKEQQEEIEKLRKEINK